MSLICPLCSAPLSAVDHGVACPANHRFDRARQGYLNLLPVQHKNINWESVHLVIQPSKVKFNA